jgi:PD-(D/E)XK nuclease superfamily
MPRISIKVALPTENKKPIKRLPVFQVLGMPAVGASPRGSTYYKSLLGCPFEHALLYDVGLRPEFPTEPLVAGISYHYILQRYYQALMQFQREFEARWVIEHPNNPLGYRKDDMYFWGGELEAVRTAWNALTPMQNAEGYKETYETLTRIVDHYFDRTQRMDRWRVMAIEETLEFYGESSGSFDYTARLDLLIEDCSVGGTTGGRMWIVEHKTARYITTDLIDFYDLDLQILGQVWLVANCLDLTRLPPFGGVLLNIVSKQKTPKLVRHTVIPHAGHLTALEETLGAWVGTREHHSANGWPKAIGHCAGALRGYSKCQFYDLCRHQPTVKIAAIKDWRDAPLGFIFTNPDENVIEDHTI